MDEAQVGALLTVTQTIMMSRPEESRVALIEGPPGTGKTHTLVYMVEHILTYKNEISSRPRILTVIVGEKEKKIKEGFRMMGLSDSVYWASWFVVYFVFVVCLTLIATGVLYGLKVFSNSNVGLVYLLFILYDLSALMLAF